MTMYYLPFDSGLIALRPVPRGGLVAQEGGIVSCEKMILQSKKIENAISELLNGQDIFPGDPAIPESSPEK
jgi:hypothetical protein